MTTLLKYTTAGALALFLTAVGAPEAFAKGHGQGSTPNPGEDVGEETVGPAQGLGSARGNGRDRSTLPGPAQDPGKSGDAGR